MQFDAEVNQSKVKCSQEKKSFFKIAIYIQPEKVYCFKSNCLKNYFLLLNLPAFAIVYYKSGIVALQKKT
jgi:hypothetical protein